MPPLAMLGFIETVVFGAVAAILLSGVGLGLVVYLLLACILPASADRP